MGWDAVGCSGVQCDAVGCSGVQWDGAERSGTGWGRLGRCGVGRKHKRGKLIFQSVQKTYDRRPTPPPSPPSLPPPLPPPLPLPLSSPILIWSDLISTLFSNNSYCTCTYVYCIRYKILPLTAWWNMFWLFVQYSIYSIDRYLRQPLCTFWIPRYQLLFSHIHIITIIIPYYLFSRIDIRECGCTAANPSYSPMRISSPFALHFLLRSILSFVPRLYQNTRRNNYFLHGHLPLL